MSRKSVPDNVIKEREAKLFEFYYGLEDKLEIEQYSPYHYRVFNKKNKHIFVDVWCIRRVYWQKGMSSSRNYRSVKEILPLLKI